MMKQLLNSVIQNIVIFQYLSDQLFASAFDTPSALANN